MQDSMPQAPSLSDLQSVSRAPSKKPFFFLAGFVFICIGVLALLYFVYPMIFSKASFFSVHNDTKRDSDGVAPFLTGESLITGTNSEWRLVLIQPVVSDFKTKDGKNFITAKINDVAYDFFVSGNVPGSSVDIIYFQDSNTDFKEVSFKELQAAVKPGTQLGIYIIVSAPQASLYDSTYCAAFGTMCGLALVDGYSQAEAQSLVDGSKADTAAIYPVASLTKELRL